MKTFLFLLIVAVSLLLVQCGNNPTQPFDFNQYQQMQNDPNWVEITDTIIENCIPVNAETGSYLYFSSYEALRNTFVYQLEIHNINLADTVAIEADRKIDFSIRDLMGFLIRGYGSDLRVRTRFFINNLSKSVRCIVEVGQSYEYNYMTFCRYYSIPKLKDNFSFEFHEINNSSLQ